MKSILSDVFIYGTTFFLTLFFSYVANDAKLKNRKGHFLFCSVMAIFIPCMLAAVRGLSVGTDVKVYAKPVFDGVKYLSFTQLFSFRTDVEIGFKILAWTIARFTGKFSAFLFAIELAILLPVYIVAVKRSPQTPIWITMIFYLGIFYCPTFNFMRQSMSAALLLLSFQFFEEKRYRKVLICALLASVFHGSTIIGIAYYCVALLVLRINSKSLQGLVLVSAAVIGSLVFLQWDVILSWLIQNGIVPVKYEHYMRIFSGAYENRYSYYFVINTVTYFDNVFRILVTVFGLIWGWKHTREKDHNFNAAYVTTMVLCTLTNVLVLVVLHSGYGIRISWNNEFILLLLLPEVIPKGKLTWKKVPLRTLVVLLTVVVYFAFGVFILGVHGVRPFVFA